MVGDLLLHRDRTLYTRWGDWFAYGDAGLLALLLVLRLRSNGAPMTRPAPATIG